MSDHQGLYSWMEEVARRFPKLSKPQACGLALWSFGMVLGRSCAQSAVSAVLARLLGEKQNTVRQRLREWEYDAEDKRGAHRCQLKVETTFGPLLGWVLSLWQSDRLAFALDATSLGDRVVVLTISVLYRGCAIPVAWAVVGAHAKESWNAHWLRRLKGIGASVPASMLVIVLTDRGLYSKDLFGAICKLGWHPLMRVQRGGTFRPEGGREFRSLPSFVPEAGTQWKGQGTAFKTAPVKCTLVAWWEAGQKEPWLLVTDLAPEAVEAAWYSLRMWIEQGFRAIKRGCWQWHNTRQQEPDRIARRWLALAVTTLWMVSVGSQCEDAPEPWECPDQLLAPPRRRRSATRLRAVGLLQQGLTAILIALIRGQELPRGWLIPDQWPRNSPALATSDT